MIIGRNVEASSLNFLVTGASSGFGEAIARAAAGIGAQVGLLARRKERLEALAQEIRDDGGRASVLVCDVGNESEIERSLDQFATDVGDCHVLVNNAGMNIAARSISDTTSDEWRRLIDVNLTSAYLFTRGVLPQMMERGDGTIVNVASRAANFPSLLAGVAYSSSKQAMQALTRITNEEGNPSGVRASMINPGVANTPILDLRPSPPGEAARQEMMQAEDIASAVLFAALLPGRANAEQIDLYPTNVSVS